MTLKALIYLVIAIAWLFMKFYEKNVKAVKKAVQKIEPPPKREIVHELKQELKKVKLPIVKKSFEQKPKEKISTNVEKKSAVSAPSPTIVTEEMKIETSSFIDEIRNGNIDWRNAILYSEILKPKY